MVGCGTMLHLLNILNGLTMIKDGLELLQKYGAKNFFFIGAIV
jgi:hypothetical protein